MSAHPVVAEFVLPGTITVWLKRGLGLQLISRDELDSEVDV